MAARGPPLSGKPFWRRPAAPPTGRRGARGGGAGGPGARPTASTWRRNWPATAPMIYLDSAAVVKLAHAEAESPALRNWLDERAETGWVSSVLAEIESFRALARYAPGAVSRLPAVL